MGGSTGIMSNAIRAVGNQATGGKGSNLGQSNYGNAPGFTPVGRNPARPQEQPAQTQTPQTQANRPQFIPGSAMNGGFGGIPGNSGFPSPFGGGFGQPQFQPQFGGKSSGLGMYGMQQSPYGQMGFNPYAQQGMGGMPLGGMGMPGNSGFPDPRMQQPMGSTFEATPQQMRQQPQFNPYAQQPQFGGLAALAQMLRGGMMYNQGGKVKDEDEE